MPFAALAKDKRIKFLYFDGKHSKEDKHLYELKQYKVLETKG
jgi:hypothetical protein